jgi:hypothetical protein
VGFRRFVRAGLGSATALLVLLLSGGTTRAALSDVGCPGPPDSFTTVSGGDREAQQFSNLHSGTLVGAQVVINKQSAGADFKVQVLRASSDGISITPVNEVISEATIPDASVPLGVSTQSVSLGAPALGYRAYALAVTRPGAGPASVGMRDTPDCQGQAYSSFSQSGEWFAHEPALDLAYETTVEPSNRFAVHNVAERKITVILPGPGFLTAREAPRARKKRKKRPRLVQTTGLNPRDIIGSYATLRMKLTHVAPVLLKAKPKLKAQVLVTYTPIGGQPGTMQVPVPLRIPKY